MKAESRGEPALPPDPIPPPPPVDDRPPLLRVVENLRDVARGMAATAPARQDAHGAAWSALAAVCDLAVAEYHDK